MIHCTRADSIGDLLDLELLRHIAATAVFRLLRGISGQLILVVGHVAAPLVMSLNSACFNHLYLLFPPRLLLKRSKWLIIIICLRSRLFLTLTIG